MKKKEDELERDEQAIIGLDGGRYVTNAPGLKDGMTLYKPKDDTVGDSGMGSKAGSSYSYAQNAPTYTNRYQGAMDLAMATLMGRKPFSYDAAKDPNYQQYEDTYTRMGQQAMDDTLARMSARTGGLASSYAGAAAQQTYNGYMSALADKVPQLRQMAYEMYLGEEDTARKNMSMLQGLENAEYGRYLDRLGQWNTDQKRNDAAQLAMAQAGVNSAQNGLPVSDAQKQAMLQQFQYGDEWITEQDNRYQAGLEATQNKNALDLALTALETPGHTLSAAERAILNNNGYDDALIASTQKAVNQKHNKAIYIAPRDGVGSPSMTLATAKAMADQGQFTDDVLRTLRDAGFNDEYLKQVYGYDEAEPEHNGRTYQRIYNQIKGGDFNVSTIAGFIERADLTDEQKDKLLTMIGY